MTQDAETAFNKLRPYPSFQRGLESGGPLLVQGALVLGRYGSSVSTAPFSPESDIDPAVDQEDLLESWAEAHSCWFPNANSHITAQGYRFYGFGGEALVYAEQDKYVHKVCRIGQYESPGRFFDRLVIAEDLHPGNIWMTEDDNIVIIDGAFFFNYPSLGLGGSFGL